MPWISIHDTLPDHKKTIATAMALKLDKDALAGKLIRLWTWALNERGDGFIPSEDMETVAEKMRWAKRPTTLFDGLCVIPEGDEHGFLEAVEGGYRIHNWDKYTARYRASEKTKASDRERKRKFVENQAEKNRKKTGTELEIAKNSSGIPAEKIRKTVDIPEDFQRNSSGKITEDLREIDIDLVIIKNSGDGAEDSGGFADLMAHQDAMNAVEALAKSLGMPFEPADLDTVDSLLGEYGGSWLLQAMQTTADRAKDKRGWGYVRGILANWRRQGAPSDNIQSPETQARPGKIREETASVYAAKRMF